MVIVYVDEAMVKFVTDLLINPNHKFSEVSNAFTASYRPGKKKNIFTKTVIQKDADSALRNYFSQNIGEIEKWFTVLQPKYKNIEDLKITLEKLSKRKANS